MPRSRLGARDVVGIKTGKVSDSVQPTLRWRKEIIKKYSGTLTISVHGTWKSVTRD